MRVALCDHHALVRDGVRPMLRHCAPEAEIIEAASYADALAVLGTGQFRLVLVEPAMPGMEPLDGIDAVRRACAGPVAVLSGIEDRATIRAMLARGIAGFIPKHLGTMTVIAALRLVLAGETFVPSLLLDEPDSAVRGPTASLTPRERTVLSLLRDGHSNKGIARHLNLSEVTIKTHLSSTFRKLGVRNRVQAARMAT